MANLFKQNYLPYLLFIAGVVLIFLWARSCRKEGFADAPSGEKPYMFKMFYADWCPHCHTAKPEFEKLGAIQTIGGKQVAMKTFESEKDADVMKAENISGFPTIRLYNPEGQLVESYPDKLERTQDAFQSYLKSKLE